MTPTQKAWVQALICPLRQCDLLPFLGTSVFVQKAGSTA